MDFAAFINTDFFTWVVIPLLIFVARICDVSIGTIRLIFISRGFKLIAPLLGFFEVLIWLFAIQQILNHMTNILCYIAYGGGFAMGTFIGMVIEEKLAVGKVLLRIITKREPRQLIDSLKNAGYAETTVDADGINTKVKIIHMIIKRQDVPKVVAIIKQFNPRAFYAIEDLRFVSDDEDARPSSFKKYIEKFRFLRLGK
jgi:uncharacterized protein YebE (UPF0316 family)